MFGTEITFIAFILTLVEIGVLFFQIINYLSRQHDQSIFRFLVLIVCFIFYNLSAGLFPDPDLQLNLIIQTSISVGSGIILAIYFYYYLVKEFNIKQDRIFNLNTLAASLISTFFIFFILGSFIINDVLLAYQIYIVFPIAISIYFCIRTVRFLYQKSQALDKEKSHQKLMVTAGYIGAIFMATMPVTVLFENHQEISSILVNMSFFLLCYAYIKRHIYQSKLEYEMITNIKQEVVSKESKQNDFPHYLTPKELEISYLILLNLKYAEIADVLYITEKTVSKHASNIFKKAQCKNKIEYIEQFSKELKKVNEAIAEVAFQFEDMM